MFNCTQFDLYLYVYNLPGHFSELWRTHRSVSHQGNRWCHRSRKETEDHRPGGHRGGQHWLQWGHQKGNHSHEVREHNNQEYWGLFSRLGSRVLLKITYCFPKTIILATAYKCTFSAGNKGLLTWLLKTGQNLTSGQLSYVYPNVYFDHWSFKQTSPSCCFKMWGLDIEFLSHFFLGSILHQLSKTGKNFKLKKKNLGIKYNLTLYHMTNRKFYMTWK